MKKLQKQIYRVECNFGSKYFKTLDKARKYFEYKVSLDFDAELWLVKYKYNSRNEICSAVRIFGNSFVKVLTQNRNIYDAK